MIQATMLFVVGWLVVVSQSLMLAQTVAFPGSDNVGLGMTAPQGSSGGVVLGAAPLAQCPLSWGPTVLTPVFYGMQDFGPSNGAPAPLRVFYPTIDGAVDDAPLLRGCGRYPLIVLLHGQCQSPQPGEHYKDWYYLSAQLARSGYVVVVPQLSSVAPWAEVNPDVDLVEHVLAWMRQEWTHRDQVMPPPATGIVGHSYGALLGGRLAPSLAASAYVSLSGVWAWWEGPIPLPLGALNAPALLTWGGVSPVEVNARLEGSNAYLWEAVKPPKHRLEFEDGEHWDYLPTDQIPCEQLTGPCALVEFLAADYTALFFSRYMPPESSTIPAIPLSLQPPTITLTPEQQFFAAGRLYGLSQLSDHPECSVLHSWVNSDSPPPPPACPPSRPIRCEPGPGNTCSFCIGTGMSCP